MQSCIYEGQVCHRRMAPVKHEFRGRIFLMYLDLSELQQVFQRHWLWSTRRVAVARFCRTDHMGEGDQPLEEVVRNFVESKGYPRPEGPIRLLTHLRYFGYVNNPVSFYYCFEKESETLSAVVAEVNNTPWGERHCYVLSPEQFDSRDEKSVIDKEFHVSPFMPMDVQYTWGLSSPDRQIKVFIENRQKGEAFFNVNMRLERREITSANLSRALLRFPLMTWRVVAGIYWQALRLWLKGTPFHKHPGQKTNNSQSLQGSTTP
ncbi:MAG: DUF1365 domain-containing protein [Pirellulaceae bacterium]|nr:DUF1365 domain-containing protein [Pirellulaceae bacterium]